MKEFVDSLSLGSGALLVAILSAGIVWLLCFLFPRSLRKLWAVTVLFALATAFTGPRFGWMPISPNSIGPS